MDIVSNYQYGCERYRKQILKAFERRVLRRICGPVLEDGVWRTNVRLSVKVQRIRFTGLVVRMNNLMQTKKHTNEWV